jgi:antibiotic biosynthesis monooxygenase (ABM) superfamily enzyme
MKRRTSLKALAAAGAASSLLSAAEGKPPIQLHLDLIVDPAKEKEMLANFQKTFRPTIRKQPGFVDVKLMKLRKVMAGDAPGSSTYRLIISFATEEQRVTWVAHPEHQKAWPTIEGTLTGKKYGALLYDLVV